ncbi:MULTISPECIES: PadR family transcriptional regulator [Bacillus]|uniref:PadR family transcriptional regulator n=1 Tax=Bacillus glycinifermentans TaxID=1664069 RepID=A0AAJ3YV53_9BACI|nr:MULTISPECIES: PadR family transcriptional regulator [Bacillus]MBU8785896.1 PadR family transcriptional regulator [Bacillus glycinifermentans]MDU0071151.1 PadR family transcriptional regulator [Bacillus sp. IG6]MED8019019.1 PadR family transcriptional regulator [Bacillus glycinifermentans]NUJ15567.1 PadR family transcriptional regulator [Bacillus glycinifermentans]QAT63790.1 PadR family transcriptional regulator [Bacillus glycinifermentans]
MKKTNPERYLPLTQATFYILLSLTEPLHGYGIMQKVDGMSGGEVKLGPGTLYGALNKLEKQGLIQKTEGTGDDRRKQYILTNEGWTVAELEFKRLSKLVAVSKSILRNKRGGNE